MLSAKDTVKKLTRFQIESILAYAYVGYAVSPASKLLHISYCSLNNDLIYAKANTGLDPKNRGDCNILITMIEEVRKEEMHGSRLSIETFFG
jgi:hypothetical protein